MIIGHDGSLTGKIDLSPANVNSWKAKGMKDLLHWSFLGDFDSNTKA
jgi:hypothetical protein